MTRRRNLIFTLVYIFLFLTPVWALQEPGDTDPPDNKYSEATFQGLKFRSIGPALTSGRIGDLAVHPDKNGTYYAAVSSGGLWKTVERHGKKFWPSAAIRESVKY